MDNLDAPQWADFIAPSPQISLDDYFLRKHVEHEYRDKSELVDTDSPLLMKRNNLSKQALNENNIHKTPVRTKYKTKGNKSSSSRKNNLKETTYENVLMEAMNNLQLSMTKLGDKTFNQSCLLDSPAFKTPSKRITRSMCAQAIMTPDQDINDKEYYTPLQKLVTTCNSHEHLKGKDNKENIDIDNSETPIKQQKSRIKCKITPANIQHKISEGNSESENINIEKSETPIKQQKSRIKFQSTPANIKHRISEENSESENNIEKSETPNKQRKSQIKYKGTPANIQHKISEENSESENINIEKSETPIKQQKSQVKYKDTPSNIQLKISGENSESENINIEKFETPIKQRKSQIKYKGTPANIQLKISGENFESENINIEKSETPIKQQNSQIKYKSTPANIQHKISGENSESEIEGDPVEKIESNKKELPKSKIVTSFSTQPIGSGSGLKKKATALTGNAWHRQVKRRMSITNQRRLSVVKPLVQNKYVSMAEAITNFHKITPQRFRTTNAKTTKAEQLRRTSFKLTRAMSPALMCKNRSRPINVLSREEQERIELEKIRQNQIKANPIRKSILKRPAPLKKVEKKMITHPEPFHLTESKKYQTHQKPEYQEPKRMHRTMTVPSIVSTDDKGVIVKNEEVLHFGIPLEPGKTKKKSTKVVPFSFEARYKQLQDKKQEKIKMMLQMEQKKIEFHARPVPTAVKTPLNKKIEKVNLTKPKITISRSTSFEERYKQVQLKKEEKIKQLLEEEKKARNFKAQKAPEFKPVLIRGRSKDNLFKKSQETLVKSNSINEGVKRTNSTLKKSQENLLKSDNLSGSIKKTDSTLKKSHENLTSKPKNLIKQPLIPIITRKNNKSLPINIQENQENQSHGTLPKILDPKCKLSQKSVSVLAELNTDKRAKQRREFDEQIKKKEMEEIEIKRREEEQRLAKEKAQKLELRKMTEIKARPMPVYKPMNIIKSNKPLTDAQSPAWAKRKRSAQ